MTAAFSTWTLPTTNPRAELLAVAWDVLRDRLRQRLRRAASKYVLAYMDSVADLGFSGDGAWRVVPAGLELVFDDLQGNAAVGHRAAAHWLQLAYGDYYTPLRARFSPFDAVPTPPVATLAALASQPTSTPLLEVERELVVVVEGAPPRIRTDLRGQTKLAVLTEKSRKLVADVAAGERCACEYCQRIRKEG